MHNSNRQQVVRADRQGQEFQQQRRQCSFQQQFQQLQPPVVQHAAAAKPPRPQYKNGPRVLSEEPELHIFPPNQQIICRHEEKQVQCGR